jgi:hypothetical protein
MGTRRLGLLVKILGGFLGQRAWLVLSSAFGVLEAFDDLARTSECTYSMTTNTL